MIEPCTLAAIVRHEGDEADLVVASFARSLKKRGWRVRGLVQASSACTDHCARSIVLLDLESSGRYPISQNLGRGSVSCCVDAGAVAAAGIVLREALAEGVDLAIANRFGKLEADGGGFAAELLALMAESVPVLTIVADRYLERWRHFTGGASVLLQPRREILEDWFASLHRKADAGGTPMHI